MTFLTAVTQVELVGDNGLGLRDLVVPILTLIGGLAGVLIAGAINRRTLEAVEVRRDQRERDLDTARHRTQLIAERRRALGAARVLERELTHRALLIERLLEDIDTAVDTNTFTIEQDGEDATLLAAWLSDTTWGYVSQALAFLQHLRWDLPRGETVRLTQHSPYGDSHGAISDALGALEREIADRLSSEAELPTATP